MSKQESSKQYRVKQTDDDSNSNQSDQKVKQNKHVAKQSNQPAERNKHEQEDETETSSSHSKDRQLYLSKSEIMAAQYKENMRYQQYLKQKQGKHPSPQQQQPVVTTPMKILSKRTSTPEPTEIQQQSVNQNGVLPNSPSSTTDQATRRTDSTNNTPIRPAAPEAIKQALATANVTPTVIQQGTPTATVVRSSSSVPPALAPIPTQQAPVKLLDKNMKFSAEALEKVNANFRYELFDCYHWN